MPKSSQKGAISAVLMKKFVQEMGIEMKEVHFCFTCE